MDLSIYNIIVGPVFTDKAYLLSKKHKKVMLWIHPFANKALVREAFKKLFNVEVENVRILIRAGKIRRVGRKVVEGSSRKKAIVTLAEGHSLNLFEQAENSVVASEHTANADKTSRPKV